MQETLVTSVRSGRVVGDGSHAIITFEAAGEAVNIAIPILELSDLLTLCMGLTAQAALQRGAVQVLPVDDWEIGCTKSRAVVLRLSSESGASLMYRFERQQALELANAVTMAAAAPSREASDTRQFGERAAQESALQLSELTQLREQCRGHPAALDLVDRCVALLAELDAANDEGRAIYRKNLVELASAAREHLRALEGLPSFQLEQPPPAAG
jgi:hypothetical protein